MKKVRKVCAVSYANSEQESRNNLFCSSTKTLFFFCNFIRMKIQRKIGRIWTPVGWNSEMLTSRQTQLFSTKDRGKACLSPLKTKCFGRFFIAMLVSDPFASFIHSLPVKYLPWDKTSFALMGLVFSWILL